MPDPIKQTITRHRAYYCLECGKCTATCPVARQDSGFSPRRIVEEVVAGRAHAVLESPLAWACLTCRHPANPGAIAPRRYPANAPAAGVYAVKVMCLGRLHPGLILKAFEQGADSVLPFFPSPSVLGSPAQMKPSNQALSQSSKQVSITTV